MYREKSRSDIKLSLSKAMNLLEDINLEYLHCLNERKVILNKIEEAVIDAMVKIKVAIMWLDNDDFRQKLKESSDATQKVNE